MRLLKFVVIIIIIIITAIAGLCGMRLACDSDGDDDDAERKLVELSASMCKVHR